MVAPSPSASTLPESFQSGRYVVSRFLGQGGTKKVYLVHDSRLNRDVAFAHIKEEGMDDADHQRILREAQTLARLGDHRNIVQIYDFGEEAGRTFMVLPLLGGGTLEPLVRVAERGELEMRVLLRTAAGICNGLSFAHSQGVIHRDLKPGNIWLTLDGTPKIGDFGIAYSTGQTPLTMSGWLLGTVGYMAPEQATGAPVDERTDLYSLGVMLYELVTGVKPFTGDNPLTVINHHINTAPVTPTWHNPNCPKRLETLTMQLLDKDPANRPPSADAVVNSLLTLAALEKIDTSMTRAI